MTIEQQAIGLTDGIKDVRCRNCDKMLFRVTYLELAADLEIKCPRCHLINTIQEEFMSKYYCASAPSCPRREKNGKG